MAIASVGEVLVMAGELEGRLQAFYAEVRDKTADNGTRLLTYHLRRHRRHLQQALEGFTKEESEHIRQTGLEHDVESREGKEFHVPDTPPDEIAGEQLLHAAIEHSETLVALYRKVLEQALTPEVDALLDTLVDLEEKDVIVLKKMAAMHYF